jgi:hypothetical protein
MSEGFFDRWSRRKQQARAGDVPEEPVAGTPLAEVARPHPGLPPEGEGKTPAPPTLADAESLTIDSDFKPFLTQKVAPEVKNAAFKKLFADPHFNVMDGLDTYIDDYSKPSPLPESVLRQMASARFLKLFDEATEAEENPHGDATPDVAQSPSALEVSSPPVADVQPASQEADDHHADLRLQPDDAAGAESARDGAD